MDKHYPIHRGLVYLSAGAMQREYIPIFMTGANDPEVMKGVILQPPVTLEGEYAWYDRAVQNRNDVLLAILLHIYDGDRKIIGYRYIGHMGLHDVFWPGGYATSGSIIWDKNCFGKGYGTEAKMLLLLEAFHNRGMRKVISHVKAFNGNSWGHLLACGYKQTGRQKRHHFYNGDFVDSIDLEVFREDWELVWAKYQKTKCLPKLTDEQRTFLQKEIGL